MINFYEFAKDFKEYLYSLGFTSLTMDCQTNYCYGKDYKKYFIVNSKYKSIWYRDYNSAEWSYLYDDIQPLYVTYLKQIASNLVKTDKQNNIKKAIEKIEKDFQ